MLKKRLTFILIPDSNGVTRQLSVRLWHLYAALILFALLMFASFFLASEFFANQVNEAELARLDVENRQLAEKYEELRWSLAETSNRYNQLVQKEIAIRSLFGLEEISQEERRLGIGGPSPSPTATLSETQKLAYGTEAEVDRLLRLSRFELEKYDEAEQTLMGLKERLDHTPSIWPTKGWNSRGYGMKYDPFTGYKQFHRGIDIAANAGTLVIAPSDGRVKELGKYRGLGKMIVIDHGYGFVTRYGHLSRFDVKRGQRVKRGDVIGKVGSTGYSTGPHLHYEVWRNSKVMNPKEFILNKM
jgi:murein DD-endopeptidase MepM/ murein hydrolase activator NlpD